MQPRAAVSGERAALSPFRPAAVSVAHRMSRTIVGPSSSLRAASMSTEAAAARHTAAARRCCVAAAAGHGRRSAAAGRGRAAAPALHSGNEASVGHARYDPTCRTLCEQLATGAPCRPTCRRQTLPAAGTAALLSRQGSASRACCVLPRRAVLLVWRALLFGEGADLLLAH